MPELPDISLYVTRLSERLIGQSVVAFKVYSPFVLRSTGVPVNDVVGAKLREISRLGKRVVFKFDNEVFLIVHLMISGRFQWTEDLGKLGKPSKIELFRIMWTNGVLSLNEASPKKRAGIWLVRCADGLTAHQRGGIDVFQASSGEFRSRLLLKNQTIKRALTDPSQFDGIGNAYSDEILFRAKISPLKLTESLSNDEVDMVFEASRSVLRDWTLRLEKDFPGFPKSNQITAFRKDFFVHGRFGEPCRECGAPIQRIVAAENEMNYCARCQNGGRIFADRSLSRLLKDDWPRTIDELLADG